jgi:hypothetical protein
MLKIVMDRISSDTSKMGLLDYIERRYLSVEAKLSLVSSVWLSLCSRLQLLAHPCCPCGENPGNSSLIGLSGNHWGGTSISLNGNRHRCLVPSGYSMNAYGRPWNASHCARPQWLEASNDDHN